MEEESKVLDNYRVIEDCLCIRMPEEVDHHRSEEICKNADHFILESQVANVVFDFEDTHFMDSSGIGLIMGRYRLMQLSGGDLIVTGASERLCKVMRLAGLDKLGILRDTAGTKA